MFLLLLAVPAVAQPDLEGLYRAGLAALQGGRSVEALEKLRAVEAADPGYRDVQILLGQTCLVAGLERDARRHFEGALAADPGNGHAAFLLGMALVRAARYVEAEEALARAHQLAPGNPHPLIYRGLALLRLGRPAQARQAIDAALERAPQEPAAGVALAELELAEGRPELAEALLREALGRTGGGETALEAEILLARALFEAGRSAEAAAISGRLLTAGPERSDVLYLHAQALLRSGRAEAGRDAMAAFRALKGWEERFRLVEAAVHRAPQDVAARLELIGLLREQRRTTSVRLHLAILRRLAPEDPRVRKLLEAPPAR